MKISACLALALLVFVGSALKIHQVHHDYDDVDTYLTDLVEQQGKFEAGMQVLANSVEETQVAARGTDDIEEKIKILESGILTQ